MAGSMDERRGRARTSIRHRGEHRFSLARIGPAVVALELVIVLIAGVALYLHERGPARSPRNAPPPAAAELPSLIDPDDSGVDPDASPSPSGTGLPSATPTGTGLPSGTPSGTGTAATTGPATTSGGPASTAPGSTAPTRGTTPPRTSGPRPPAPATRRPTTAPATRPATTRRTTPPRTTQRPQVPSALPDAAVAAQLVNHLNGRRAGAGCPALRLDNRLSRAAQGHADDMVRRHFFRHTNPDGLGPSERAAQQGYSGSVAEVIAVGFENAARAVDEWWNSPSHFRILTTCGYRSIGVGWNPGQPLSGNAPGAWVAVLG